MPSITHRSKDIMLRLNHYITLKDGDATINIFLLRGDFIAACKARKLNKDQVINAIQIEWDPIDVEPVAPQ